MEGGVMDNEDRERVVKALNNLIEAVELLGITVETTNRQINILSKDLAKITRKKYEVLPQ